ncbi:DivIVA domain-containing protein [Lactobacillus sp. LL6]|uniref:DivIVA domain-containing protein n=1 Tax=Lactobacillus sp. LL6 TaxID=2596827 RepID=UPI0011859342|nr:DivIVA domain-containing protein [Lactobacillus sp. LL6]TSO26173.1 DivIVA domain-containing protein [Lactobacillus sp. LL6]
MADKKLTPIDINKKEFTRRGRRGYDRYEVDSFLDQVVEDYGNVLDKNADLNNELTLTKERLNDYKAKAEEYDQKKSDLNQSIISAQEAAKKIKADAQKEADELLNNAQDQASVDTKYEKQQQEVLNSDYQRLKQEVNEFRNHIQNLLQKQIDSLNDEDWQHELDKYFGTDRFYPEDGSEPIPSVDSDEEFDEDDADFDDVQVDNSPLDDVNSYQDPHDDENTSHPLIGDSPSQETVNVEKPKPKKHTGTTIVFPDTYKK